MKRKFEDKIIKVIDKMKFSPRVFGTILSNCTMFNTLILQNDKRINITEVTDGYSYVNACITKYQDMIVSYNKQKKPTKLFHDELEKNNKLLTEYENRLLKLLEKELPFTKEIIMNGGTHIIITNKMFHSLEGPCIYNDDWEHNKENYYINDELLDKDDWNKHPMVRSIKINKLIKKINKKNKLMRKN